MFNKDHFCGGCRHFGYEDVYGLGYCLKDEGFKPLKYCEEPCCSKYEERYDEEGQEDAI